jgi:hypothetical protein
MSSQPQQGRNAEGSKGGKSTDHGNELFVETRHRAPPNSPGRWLA